MTMYFGVYAMCRADLSEWIVALISTEAMARVVAWRTLEDTPHVVRCRVKRVYLSRQEVFEVVRVWGQMDAARGRPLSDADTLPEPFHGVYIASYRNAERG